MSSDGPISTSIRVYPIRFPPNVDVLAGVRNLMSKAGLQATFIMTCVGSVKACRLRMANSYDTRDLTSPHEIVSLVGTFDGESCHLHGTFSDGQGQVIGGHVLHNHPMVVYTTVELMLAECENVIFKREMDDESGYPELVIKKKN